MTGFEPQSAGWEARVRDSFARQGIMKTLGAELTRVEPGAVEIAAGFRPGLTQQHGYFHAGVTATLADSAGGYAGFTLMPDDASVLTVEFKLNLLAPAAGDRFIAIATVVRAGRTLTVVRADVHAGGKLVATMLGTMIAR